MIFILKIKNSEKKLKPFTNKDKLDNIISKGIFLRMIINLLFSLRIIVFKIK